MSESRAKRQRKEQVAPVEVKKKSKKGVLFNIIAVLVIVAVAGVGGYAAYEKIQENAAANGETVPTVADIAAEKSLTTEELLAKIGIENEDITDRSTQEELFEVMSIENFAKYNDLDVAEFKAMYGIENLDNGMLWSEAQMEVKMSKVAETEYGISFEEFALQNQLPEEITADMTQAEAIAIMQAQSAE